MGLLPLATPAEAEIVPIPDEPVQLSADIRVTGSVENPAPSKGISASDALRYKVAIANNGPGLIPAGALTVVVFVANNGDERATIEVSRFAAQNLVAVPSAVCGVGRQQVLQCTNRVELAAGEGLSLAFENRHPTAVAGPLLFDLSVTLQDGAGITDPNGANNSYRGPAYRFAVQPSTTTTTTTTLPPSTTVATTTTTEGLAKSTTSPESTVSSMVDPSTTTTTVAATTTTIASTSLGTTSTVATTVTTATTATTLPTSATINDPNSTENNSVSVLGAQGGGEGDATGGGVATGDTAVALAAPGESGGGFPWLLVAGLFAALLMLGGLGIGYYTYYNRPPPLVDIRQERHF